MAINKEAFVKNYIDETLENIDRIDSEIIKLKNDRNNVESLTSLLRALHTIKGSSRMLGFRNMEKLAHGLESVFKGVREKRYEINHSLIQLVFITTDYFQGGIERIRQIREDQLPVKKILSVYEKAEAREPYSLDGLKLSMQESRDEEKTDIADYAEQDTIRIQVSRIDHIVKLLNNLIIKQFQFRRENEAINRLEESILNIQLALGSVVKNDKGSELSTRIKDCLREIQKLKKDFLEDSIQIERNTFELQGDILSLRMLPMRLVLDPLKKMVAETALLMEKEIDFQTEGTGLLLDKIILEQINDPIIHLVRNAIDHGIEKPEERVTKGKGKTGKVDISCSSEAGKINIKIQDDGRGIDYNKIRSRAIELYPEQEDDIREMDERNLSTFLFNPGFSTKETITDLSGRGIGLDIVRHNIEHIKGKITVNSEKDRGTEFTLSLPLSLATVDGFFTYAGGEKFLIPATFVREILKIQQTEMLDLLNRKAIRLRENIIPVYPLSALLNKRDDRDHKDIFVIVVEAFGEIVGIIVDSIIQYSSLIYKPLPGNLMNLKVIQGIVFDESFNIINILYVPELIERFKRMRNIESKKKYSKRKKEYKQVLVVDDSFSTREVIKSILQLEDYNVSTAVDGIDAIEKMKERYFHLVITDIQMPRMDGYTLVENIRRDDKYKRTPFIFVTSDRDSVDMSELDRSGGDVVIAKSEFDRGNLLSEVKRLIG